MKLISNIKSTEVEMDIQIIETNESSTLRSRYAGMELNSDSDQDLTAEQLISCVNAQFEMLYKSNQKRKYLLKEISSYIVR